jgi:Ca-activated chloride channel family protein
VNNTGDVTPLQAAEAALKYNIKVYTIGVGTRGKAKAPIAPKGDGSFVYGFVDVEIDEKLLSERTEERKVTMYKKVKILIIYFILIEV